MIKRRKASKGISAGGTLRIIVIAVIGVFLIVNLMHFSLFNNLMESAFTTTTKSNSNPQIIINNNNNNNNNNNKKNTVGKVLGVKMVLGVRVVILWLPFQRPIPAFPLCLGVRLRA